MRDFENRKSLNVNFSGVGFRVYSGVNTITLNPLTELRGMEEDEKSSSRRAGSWKKEWWGCEDRISKRR